METVMTCRDFIQNVYVKDCSNLRKIFINNVHPETLEEAIILEADMKGVVLEDIGRMRSVMDEVIYE